MTRSAGRGRGVPARLAAVAPAWCVMAGLVASLASCASPAAPGRPPALATAPSSARSAPARTPEAGSATFADGTHRVGLDIRPGTYRTRTGSPGCYFARLKGFGGTVGDVIANENSDAPAVVTIAAADRGFESDGCGTWTRDLSAITRSRTAFDDGDYIVGTDIQPGAYRSEGRSDCYYARLRGFGHTIQDIVANGNTSASVVVTVAPGDRGFESSGCGAWARLR